MRKIYISLLSMLFVGISASAVEVPYSSPIAVSDSDFDEGWTIINANGDARQWAPIAHEGGNTPYMVYYNYAYSTPADDYLISPPLQLKGGSNYKLSFKMKTEADAETLTVYLAKSSEEEQIKEGVIIFDWDNKSDKTLTAYSATVTPNEDGEYYISWYAHSPQNKNKIYLCDMTIAPDEFAPAPVSSLTATPGANRELKCDLNWILPSTTILGEPFTDDQEIELIEIFRDDAETPIASFTEAITTFTDTEATGLTSGRHTYSVVVTVAGVKSAVVSTDLTPYIGPITPMNLPVSITIDNQDNFDLFSVVYGENTDVTPENQWHFGSSYIGKYASHNRTAKNTQEDSWLISPPIKIEEAGNYSVTFNASISNQRRANKLDAYFGQSAEPKEMTLKEDIFDLSETAADFSFAFNAPEAGTYYVAFHAAAESDTYAQEYHIYNLNVEAVGHQAIIPAPVAALKAKGSTDQSLNINVSWMNPTTDFAGTPITTADYAVKIYLDDEEEAVMTISGEEIVTDTRQVVSIPVDKAGIHSIKVATVSIADPIDNPDYREVKTNWVGGRCLNIPYVLSLDNESVDKLMWNIIDANEDDKTFTLNSSNFSLVQPVKGENGLYAYNDYLISPSFSLEKGYYIVKYKVTGGEDAYIEGTYQPKTNFSYHLGVAESGKITETNQEFTKKSELLNVACDSYDRAAIQEYIFEINEQGVYDIIIAADVETPELSPTKYFTLHDFSFEKMPLLPGKAQDLSVSAGPDKALSATINWKNPTETNIDGATLSAGEIVKAVIYRNEEQIAEITSDLIPGSNSSYIDSTVPGPGKYEYTVELYSADGAATEVASVLSPWIGAGLPAEAKYEGDDFENWTLIDANNDYDEYLGHNAWAVHTENGLRLRNPNNTADDWAISPRHEFEAGKSYKLTLESRFDLYASEKPYTFDIYLSEDEDHTGIRERHLLQTIEILPEYTSNAEPQVTEIYIAATSADTPSLLSDDTEEESPTINRIESGTRNIAIHANSQGEIYVKSVAIESSEITTGIKEANSSDIALSSDAILFDGKAVITVVFIDGTVVEKAETENFYPLDSLAKGIYIIDVTTASSHASFRIIR